MHEFFEHTADLGLRIEAPDLNTLFSEAGLALFSAIVENVDVIRCERNVTIRLPFSSMEERDFLFFDWLRELLYRFDVEHLVFGKFDVRIDENGLEGTAWGEPFDRDRHLPLHEVKAITYHGLRVEPKNGGWLAEVIVDI